MRSIVLHHTADKRNVPQSESVDAHHKGKGFPKSSRGFYGGYHYLIEKNGDIVQFRKESEVGAHTVAFGRNWNKTSIGVCLAGHFEKEDPSDAQIRSVTSLVVDIQKRWGIPDSEIYLHREIKATACPAVDLRTIIAEEYERQLRTRINTTAKALERSKGRRRSLLQRILERLSRALSVDQL